MAVLRRTGAALAGGLLAATLLAGCAGTRGAGAPSPSPSVAAPPSSAATPPAGLERAQRAPAGVTAGAAVPLPLRGGGAAGSGGPRWWVLHADPASSTITVWWLDRAEAGCGAATAGRLLEEDRKVVLDLVRHPIAPNLRCTN